MKEMMMGMPHAESFEDAVRPVMQSLERALVAMHAEHREQSTPDEYAEFMLASMRYFEKTVGVYRDMAERDGKLSASELALLKQSYESGALTPRAADDVRVVLDGGLEKDVRMALGGFAAWKKELESHLDELGEEMRERVVSSAGEWQRFLEEQQEFWGIKSEQIDPENDSALAAS